jgi:hypothetical protein
MPAFFTGFAVEAANMLSSFVTSLGDNDYVICKDRP